MADGNQSINQSISISMSSASSSTSTSPSPSSPPAVEMDRVIKDVVAPPLHSLSLSSLVDSSTRLPNLSLLKSHFLKEGRLSPECVHYLISTATSLFSSESNVLELNYPITVCGDVHGQFFDLVRLMEVGGDPKHTQYLFLGDYVDRGCFSTEVVLYLYAHKIVYPKSLFLLRGNHECRQLTSFFNFKDECLYKYNLFLYDSFMSSFDHLPLAALINKSFFCVHGGLSPDVTSIEEIRQMERVQEIPREGKFIHHRSPCQQHNVHIDQHQHQHQHSCNLISFRV